MFWKIFLVIFLGDFVLSEKDAISEQRIVIHHSKSEQNDNPSHNENKKEEYHEEYAWSYPSYEFSYKVKDPETHDEKGQHEKREGDEVKGLYWLIEPNGHKRTVNYEANDNKGFNAQVDYSPKYEENENENKNIKSTYEVVEILEEDDTSDLKNNDIKQTDNVEENITNPENTEDTTTTQANMSENNENENENLGPQENSENSNINNNNNVDETANQYANNEQSQNEKNNNPSDNETQGSEGKEKVRRENKGYNTNRHNRNSKNRSHTRVKNSIKHQNALNRKNQYNIKTGHQNKVRKNETIDDNNIKNQHKESMRTLRDDKNKEYNSNIKLQTSKSEKNLVKINYIQKNDTAEINKENNNDRELKIEDNKNVKYEHRIRVYHPKPFSKKSDKSTDK